MPDSNNRSLPNKVVVYRNRCSCVMTFADNLELFFDSDDDLYEFDILRLHGNLSRDEKAQIIDLFVNGSEATSHFKMMNVLCATSGVGNTGINSSEVRSVIDFDSPHRFWI